MGRVWSSTRVLIVERTAHKKDWSRSETWQSKHVRAQRTATNVVSGPQQRTNGKARSVQSIGANKEARWSRDSRFNCLRVNLEGYRKGNVGQWNLNEFRVSINSRVWDNQISAAWTVG
ncbi:hypothetical protein DITRI_Ditri04bG0026300 [Diplodiscus trichospermus]